jgi:hypothetical protein
MFYIIGALIVALIPSVMIWWYVVNKPDPTEPKFRDDSVGMMIKQEYWAKFEAQEFTITDFNWDNIEKISYEQYFDRTPTRCITVYLKKHGEKEVLSAVDHFNTLDFVELAYKIGIGSKA